jgi:hypothetical protein
MMAIQEEMVRQEEMGCRVQQALLGPMVFRAFIKMGFGCQADKRQMVLMDVVVVVLEAEAVVAVRLVHCATMVQEMVVQVEEEEAKAARAEWVVSVVVLPLAFT